MHRIVLGAAMALLSACSAGSDRGGPDDGSSGAFPGGPGGTVAGGATTGGIGGVQAGGAQTGGQAGGGPIGGQAGGSQAGGQTGGFQECAETKYSAERAPRGSNIVWAIDTSGSMDEEATLVQQNLNRFVQTITAAGLEDYRVVVIS
jgi:hypothetical protein